MQPVPRRARGLTSRTGAFTNLLMRITKLLVGWVASLMVAVAVLAADAPATFKVSEFTFKRPAAWKWVVSTSEMRKAQLEIVDTAKNQKADVVFYHFGPGSGGSTQANVDRWLGQFAEP